MPPEKPVAIMVPIGAPSFFKISKEIKDTPFRTVSPIAWPGPGAVLTKAPAAARVWVPVIRWPLTAAMSPMPTAGKKFLGGTGVVRLESVANLETSVS